MTALKIAVSVPRETLQRAKRAVARGRATSLSAYVADALDQKVTLDELDEMLDEMLEESGGPLTAREITKADRAILGPIRGAKRKTTKK